jgi:hypothetical protein
MAKKKQICTANGRMQRRHKGVVPATAKGKVMVKKLGRTKKTGGFAKIAAKAGTKYGSKEKGKKVAGRIYWNMVKARRGK